MCIYKNMVFVLHKKCNASCAMCCFESNPESVERLDINRIRKYVIESKEISCITDVSFTGGEPFLEYRKLLDLCALAKDCGKRVRTITNGYWAASYNKALDRLSELKENGVVKLTVSHDNYHSKYVETECVNNVLKACNEIGLNCDVSLVKIKNEKIGDLIDKMAEDLNNIPVNIIPCLPVGGASKTFSLDDFDRKVTPGKTRCHYGSSFVVSYDGNIYPCCSQTIFDSVLNVGNFYDINLHSALYKLKNNSALYLLRNECMGDFVLWVKENTDIKIPSKVVNVCELCGLLFSPSNVIKTKKYIDERIGFLLSKRGVYGGSSF
ncbi:radical SAM protein [Jejubacter calystegiae]|nr:radical SAM protein [Jejubacter calystegiae]